MTSSLSNTASVRDDGARIWISFTGHLTGPDGRRSADEVRTALAKQPRELVLDVREMSGYESAARQAWMDKLYPMRARLLAINVIGGSTLVKMGASTIALFLRVKYRYVDRPEALQTAAK